MRNQVMIVPKRRPPRPHSCSWSRSPLRQCAAANPNHEIRANSTTKTESAVQLSSSTAFPQSFICFDNRVELGASFLDGEVDDRVEHGTEQHQGELEPIE